MLSLFIWPGPVSCSSLFTRISTATTVFRSELTNIITFANGEGDVTTAIGVPACLFLCVYYYGEKHTKSFDESFRTGLKWHNGRFIGIRVSFESQCGSMNVFRFWTALATLNQAWLAFNQPIIVLFKTPSLQVRPLCSYVGFWTTTSNQFVALHDKNGRFSQIRRYFIQSCYPAFAIKLGCDDWF